VCFDPARGLNIPRRDAFAGCMTHNYKEKDIGTCMKARRVVFIGDSVTRQLFFSFAHKADASLPVRPASDAEKHIDYTYRSKSGVDFNFYWDPYLNTTYTQDVLSATANFAEPGQPRDSQPPLMLILGSGLWYLRHSDLTGGLPAWSKRIETTFNAISKGGSKIASTVVFLPVEAVVVEELREDRRLSMHPADIEAMNADLSNRIAPPTISLWSHDGTLVGGGAPSTPPLPIAFPLAFNKMLDASQSTDGLHFSSTITSAQINVLLNYQCNEALPTKFPRDHTCCRAYPTPSYLQLLVLFVVVAWGPIARFGRSYIGTFRLAVRLRRV